MYTSSASPNESEVVELGDLVLHDSGTVSQLRGAVLVVSRSYSDQRAVTNVPQSYHFECHW